MKAENTTKIQFDSLSVNEAYARGAAAALPEDALAGSATTSSVMVFHAPQDGQRPSQRGLVSPHWVQT